MSLLFTEIRPGYPVLEIQHPAATARIALQGAHVLEWTPAGQSPVLYLSPEAVYAPGQPIRGGIPICWPWFGPHPTDPSLPAHGFARLLPWTLDSSSEDETGVRLVFTLTNTPDTLLLWPHPFRLELEIHLGAALHLALRMTHLGPEPCPVTAALHTYFTTADIHQTRVTGLHHIAYHEKIVTPHDHIQQGDVTFDREVDRLYATGSPVQILDPAGSRTLTITGSGSASTVVWNPWINKSKILTDLPDLAYLHFLCVENCNAGPDARTLAPSTPHTLAATIQVS